MINFKNCIKGLNMQEPCLTFLKNELETSYSFGLVRDLFSLPCMQYETKHKLSMIFALLEDREINDTIIDWLTQILSNITADLWASCEVRLSTYIESNHFMLSRSQLMLLANTIEVMYAKGFNTYKLLNLIYQRLSLSDVEFNPDSDDNVRIKLAKIAYSTSKFNICDSLATIENVKHHLKVSEHKHLLGMLNYYKGLCLEVASYSLEFKDSKHYILKSRNKGFALASIYLNYRGNNVETSKKS